MIDGLRTIGAATRVAGRPATRVSDGRGAFTVPDDEMQVAGGMQAAAPAALDAMLALQEVALGEVGEREARRHGQLMLSALAELQRALLAGGIDAAVLARLQDLIDGLPRSADPMLQHALLAVALRARVEVARRAAKPFAAGG